MRNRDYVLIFGKFKGKTLENTPLTYLDWLLSAKLHDSTREAIEGYLSEPVIKRELEQEFENMED
ncbi:hypothetical protein LCGC14_2198560 [marine sediment metagenome]|uniref:Uncharacterized protein n=1 Tax=marine sediment metagenome TaxID=412755 RepID=A0A0F9GD54_9ZZZZ